MNLLPANLNEQQKKAVTTTDGAVLVLSGAGTGKTSVLTARVAYIIGSGLARPWEVLALTFTNKAAAEMKNRIAASISDDDAGNVWCGTFHSVCLRILRRYSENLGLPKNFSIFDETDVRIVLKSVIENMGLDTKEYNPTDWVDFVSAYKMSGPEKQPTGINKKIMDEYNFQLHNMNAMDFDDIILKTLDLFEKFPEILEKYQRQFKYVMVDEFQDTNFPQYNFILKIVDLYKNICCVGDDDQSIYSWRGADIKNILNFDKTFPGATIIRLTINYRSTANILGAANSVIKNNFERMGKDLIPHDDDNRGEPVCILNMPTDWNESSIVANSILRGVSAGAKYSDFAILIRTASLSRNFENEFIKQGIPYKMSGGPKIYERSEIKDAIAYIKLLINSNDNVAFRRIIGKPRRGFGDVAIKNLITDNLSLMESLKVAKLSPRLRGFADGFINLFNFDWAGMPPYDAVQKLLNDSGYIKMLKDSKKPEDANKVDNLIGFLDTIKKADSLEEFLFQISLHETEDDNISKDDKANLMTMHAAKGLEFDTVFLPAWEENIFPNEKAISEGGLEEERRLAYVSITRAKKMCVITTAASRSLFGKTVSNPASRFISEIDGKYAAQSGLSYGYTPQPKYELEKSYDRPSVKINLNTYVGKQVVHIDMGAGVVIAEDGDILTIAFKNLGIKKVAKNFVQII